MSFSLFVCLTFIVFIQAQPRDDCQYCMGEPYECISGRCYCASGFVPNYYQNSCVKCPGLGENCYDPCCSKFGNETLHCWHGICQLCYGPQGNWICREPVDHFILISGSQIVMAVALVLAVIASFVLLYKLCAATDLRAVGNRSNSESRLSVGSLQIYVNERLQDAPPRYSRAAPMGSAVYPASIYLNAGFIHDNSVPPPPYTPQRKDESNQNVTLHI